MISVNLAFILLAGVVFLGFLVTALFDKFRITSVMPLMLIGLLIGPILGLVNSAPGSTIAQLSPYITAITVSFVLFDVGLNINFAELRNVIVRATGFMMLLVFVTALVSAIMVFYFLGWNLIDSFIFGFAISGPSSMIVPTLLKSIKLPGKLRISMLYEGVSTDTFQLIIPILLLGIVVGGNATVQYAVSTLTTNILSSVAFGFFSALFWLYILSRFKEQSSEYSWMLTIAMVIATYGIAQELGISGAMTIFIFGVSFANLGMGNMRGNKYGSMFSELVITQNINHIKRYQKEITFFASTFFFVYIGLLFKISGSNGFLGLILIGIAISFIMLGLRFAFSGILGKFMHNDSQGSVRRFERNILASNIGRGLSPAIIATIPLSLGIVIPGFLNEVFIIILLTNIISAFTIMAVYKRRTIEDRHGKGG